LGQLKEGNLHDNNDKIVVIHPLQVPNQPSVQDHTMVTYTYSSNGDDSQCHQGGNKDQQRKLLSNGYPHLFTLCPNASLAMLPKLDLLIALELQAQRR
jgi:hypothetical protein